MKNKVMLITGSGTGIGYALAAKYSTSGYCSVIGCGRSRRDSNHFDSGEDYRYFQLDVSDEVAVTDMFTSIRNCEGRLDVLINNAGTGSMNAFLLMPTEKVREIYETNVIGSFLMMREAVKLMNRGGRIVNIGSAGTRMNIKGEAAYISSKAAIENLTLSVARELGHDGITVNTVAPTPIKTELLYGIPEEKIDKILEQQAIPRFAEYKDVANVVDFFLRPESDFITGQTIFLGGV